VGWLDVVGSSIRRFVSIFGSALGPRLLLVVDEADVKLGSVDRLVVSLLLFDELRDSGDAVFVFQVSVLDAFEKVLAERGCKEDVELGVLKCVTFDQGSYLFDRVAFRA